MKIRLFSMLVAALLLAGAAAAPAPATDTLQSDLAPIETQENIPGEAPITADSAAAEAATEPAATEPVLLTAGEAKAIALAHAGLSADQVQGLKAEYDVDDGVKTYDVEFRSGDYEYDYTIHAETGKVLASDKEYDPVETRPAATEPAATEPAVTEPVLLTAAEAKAIALAHAGLSADQVQGLKAEYDVDDGVKTYDVEFRSGDYEYDYTIHAETGKILSCDKEKDD